MRTEDLLLWIEEARNGRTFWVGGGTGRPLRPIGDGLTDPRGTPIRGLAKGVGSLSKRVERRDRVGDPRPGRGPVGETVRCDGEGEGESLLLSWGETGGDARVGERGRAGDSIFFPPNGLRAGLCAAGGGLGLLMEARGEPGGERRRIEALGEPGGLLRIMEVRGERGGDGGRAMGGGDL